MSITPRLISCVELARAKGVSKPAVSQLLKRHPECRVGDRVNVDHPHVVKWLGFDWPGSAAAPTPTPKAPPPKAAPPTPVVEVAPKAPPAPTAPRPAPPKRTAPPADQGSNEDLERLAKVLRPLLERFGTERNFRDWLLSLKEIESIREKRLSNGESEGDLIPRDLVKTHVFSVIEQQNRRLLGDTPKTIARRAYALARSGAPIEETETMVREAISSQLSPAKARVVKVLRDA